MEAPQGKKPDPLRGVNLDKDMPLDQAASADVKGGVTAEELESRPKWVPPPKAPDTKGAAPGK